MECLSPEKCKEISSKWEKRRATSLAIGEKRLEEIRRRYYEKADKKAISLTGHIKKRGSFRAFSETIDVNLVLKYGWVIEYYTSSSAKYMTIMGYAREYRPLHVTLALNNGENQWKVVTAYDPRTEAFRWTNGYQEKICFCR